MKKLRLLVRACALSALAGVGVYLYAVGGSYTLIGWNNLGMHCMDSDYSVFSILPPYNTVYAQLIDRNGRLVTSTSGLTVTYEAVSDPSGSINSTSAGKTQFWDEVLSLFGVSLPVDAGLAGKNMPGAANQPQAMDFDPASSNFIAEGIPLTPYDDAGRKNYYPLMHLVARDGTGSILAQTDVVLPVSDEMDCRACHASDSSDAAKPTSGWVRDGNPERDYRLNILLLHDQMNGGNAVYKPALIRQGYDGNGLYPTVTAGNKPILCAGCHGSNALPGTGLAGISPLTQAVHSLHGGVVDPTQGITLDSDENRSACYRCHPGSSTRCLRGVMGSSVAPDGTRAIHCQDCHGPMSAVGSTNRQGWLNEPNCQSCHTGNSTTNSGQLRYTSAFDTPGHYRQPASSLFATNPDTPLPGTSLFRFSRGHGGLFCSACHGSTHAEYPSTHLNDNIQSTQLQDTAGTIADCATCHNLQPSTVTGGPHGIHPVGQQWANGHGDIAEHGASQCQACHGADYRGTELSRSLGNRTFSTRFGVKTFWRGFRIGCYACHNGPSSENSNPNRAPVATSGSARAIMGRSLTIPLTVSDADGNSLSVRVVAQPAHGTVAISGRTATYYPEANYAGPDSFTFAAWDGSTDSNLGTVSLNVVRKFILPFYQEGPSSYTGLAFSNYSSRDATLDLTAYGTDGQPLPLGRNPARIVLNPRTQTARLASQIFGTTGIAAISGWIEAASDNAEIGCFFQFGGSNRLDGSVALDEPAANITFTRVFEGPGAIRGRAATTYLSLANPSEQSVTLTLTLFGPQPESVHLAQQTQSLPAKGMLFGSVSQVFGESLAVSGGYIQVAVSGAGAAGFELIQCAESDSDFGLNGVTDVAATHLYSAQLAATSGYFTILKLINTQAAARQVTLRAVAEDGTDLALPVILTLQGAEAYEHDVMEVFSFTGGRAAIGSLIVDADGPGVIGDVIFGEPSSLRFMAALQLQGRASRQAIFSHVANGQGWFTGLALFNPTLITSNVTIEVYSPEGVRTGVTTAPVALGPGKRISKVLTELIPGTLGQMGGYIVLSSTQPMIAQEVFGDSAATLLSAVPPAIIQ